MCLCYPDILTSHLSNLVAYVLMNVSAAKLAEIYLKGHMQRGKIFSKFDFIWKIYVNK